MEERDAQGMPMVPDDRVTVHLAELRAYLETQPDARNKIIILDPLKWLATLELLQSTLPHVDATTAAAIREVLDQPLKVGVRPLVVRAG
jgi:hypothetical protein